MEGTAFYKVISQARIPGTLSPSHTQQRVTVHCPKCVTHRRETWANQCNQAPYLLLLLLLLHLLLNFLLLLAAASLSAQMGIGGILGEGHAVGGWGRVFMLALVSRVGNCPEGAHSSPRARLKVCEPSGQSREPQWPYTGPSMWSDGRSPLSRSQPFPPILAGGGGREPHVRRRPFGRARGPK